MKIYPVNIKIEYTSGRIEEKKITKGYEQTKKALEYMVEFGGVKSYIMETAQDRENKKLGGLLWERR